MKPRAFRKTHILIAGCGQVGMRLLELNTKAHFTATYRKNSGKDSPIRALSARALCADLTKQADLKRIASICQRIIWMAPPDPEQTIDRNIWKLALYQASSRWRCKPGRITYVSTTGVYGNHQGEWIDEHTPTQPESARAKRRVAQETMLKLACKLGYCHAAIARAPGIYGKDRLPIARLKNGTPALIQAQDSWSNHIHEVDLARLCLRMNFAPRVWQLINAVDTLPLKMGDWFDLVADTFKLPKAPRKTAEAIQVEVSPMMWSFMRESRRIRSVKMETLRFKLRYPTVMDYLKSITLN